MTKSVKVHDDTHRVLKQIKSQTRGKSIDEVIRSMIRKSMGVTVESFVVKRRSDDLSKYIESEKQK